MRTRASAGDVVLDNSGRVFFQGNSTGANATITNIGSGTVDFSATTGPLGDGAISSGSIAGSGTFFLGADQLTVGGNNLSTAVSGTIQDGGAAGGTGGSLVKVGIGTLTLTGSNTYTGGTTIRAGTLQLGDGGTSGSIVGDVVNNGTLAINRSDVFTFDGTITGTGAFQQIGSGTTILTGPHSYQGSTTVSAGSLLVDGEIAASSGVSVNAGAVLAGNGTLASTTIQTGGRLAPGNNAVGVLTVSGNLTFQSAAAYLVQVSPTSASSTFVTGSTAIAGTLTANALGGAYTADQIFPVLTSRGPLTGTFNLATTGNFGSATLSLAYSAHQVFLILTANISTPPVWKAVPGSSDWNTASNWQNNTVPTATDIAQFNASTITTINIQRLNTQVAGLRLNPGAPAYTFNITGSASGASSLIITGSGVANISDNAPNFVVSGASGLLGTLQFRNSSTADDAVITTNAFGQTIFSDHSTAGDARLIANAGGVVDFSGTTGPAGNKEVQAGSIEGAGTYYLGANRLIVGTNDLSTTLSGTINDGGLSGGTGASLVKIGSGTLILTGANTYTGLTQVLGGTLQLGDGGTSGSIIGNVQDQAVFAVNRSDAYALAGRITGDGSFVQMGSGTTIFTADNSYAGGTIISAGTLQLGNGGTSGSIIGNVLNNGVLAINRSDTLTLGGIISGSGALQQNGTGTTILSAVNTYSGPTSVNAGALVVNGSIADSAVTVGNGARLGGDGTVGATTILSGGALAPGNSPGTLTIAGNLAFQSGAFYVVQLNSTASLANVTGTASLAGSVVAGFPSGNFRNRYTILSAAGGLNGTTFNSLSTSNLPAGFTPSLNYTATDVILNLAATLGVGSGGLNENQRNVAAALNNLFNNGSALPSNFLPIFNLTGANLGNALSQLSGEAATGAQQVGFQMESQFLGLMLDPFVDGRSGVAGASGPALGFASEREALPADIALAYSSVLKAPTKSLPVYEPRWTAWGGAYGGGNRTSGDRAVPGSHDLSANTAGFAGGLDYQLTRDNVVGFALAGGGANWSLAQGLGGGRSDVFQAGLYGATRSGAAYLAAAFAYANHWMSTDRFALAGDHLTASFNAQSLGARVESGYRFATLYGGLTPYAAIQAQSFRTPSYSEVDTNGSGFALAYAARTGTDTRSELGARLDRLLALYPGATLSLRTRLAWAHDWVSDPALAPVFQTLPGASFMVNGATPAKDSALASAGTELRLANGATLLAKFDGEFAAHSTTYAGTGTIRYAW